MVDNRGAVRMKAQFADGDRQKPIENKQVTAMVNDSDLQQWYWVRERLEPSLAARNSKSWIEPVVLSSVRKVSSNFACKPMPVAIGYGVILAISCVFIGGELNPEIRQVDICVEGRAVPSAVENPNPKCQCKHDIHPPFSDTGHSATNRHL